MAAVYALHPGKPTSAIVEATSTTELPFIRWGTAAFVMKSGAATLERHCTSKLSEVVSASGRGSNTLARCTMP